MISSAEEFDRLCMSQIDEDIARSIQDSATQEIWQEILEKFPHRMSDVAQNLTIQDSVIYVIAGSENEVAKSLIAEKRRLPSDLFAVLGKDSSEVVRRKIASNKKTPIETLDDLTRDLISDVASVALYNLKNR